MMEVVHPRAAGAVTLHPCPLWCALGRHFADGEVIEAGRRLSPLRAGDSGADLLPDVPLRARDGRMYDPQVLDAPPGR
jgi:hypothetical protein